MFTILQIFLISASIHSKPLDSLRSTFASKKGFEVEFTQEVKQNIFPDQKDKATGHVKFIRPHHLVWLYQSPTKRAIEYDGRELRIEEDSHIEKIRDSGQITLQESFSFLWGQPNTEVFSVETKDNSTFKIKPRDVTKAGFKFIEVTVNKGLVTEALVHDHLDGESILHFQNWKLL